MFYVATSETKEEIITEKINPGYEAQIYVLTRFMQLKKEPLDDFKRIIYLKDGKILKDEHNNKIRRT